MKTDGVQTALLNTADKTAVPVAADGRQRSVRPAASGNVEDGGCCRAFFRYACRCSTCGKYTTAPHLPRRIDAVRQLLSALPAKSDDARARFSGHRSVGHGRPKGRQPASVAEALGSDPAR